MGIGTGDACENGTGMRLMVIYCFQDQVLSRSDMWRFTNSLVGIRPNTSHTP